MDRDSLYRIRRWNGFYANTMKGMNKKGSSVELLPLNYFFCVGFTFTSGWMFPSIFPCSSSNALIFSPLTQR